MACIVIMDNVEKNWLQSATNNRIDFRGSVRPSASPFPKISLTISNHSPSTLIIFRCVLASREKGLSVLPWVRPSVRPCVTPTSNIPLIHLQSLTNHPQSFLDASSHLWSCATYLSKLIMPPSLPPPDFNFFQIKILEIECKIQYIFFHLHLETTFHYLCFNHSIIHFVFLLFYTLK